MSFRAEVHDSNPSPLASADANCLIIRAIDICRKATDYDADVVLKDFINEVSPLSLALHMNEQPSHYVPTPDRFVDSGAGRPPNFVLLPKLTEAIILKPNFSAPPASLPFEVELRPLPGSATSTSSGSK